MTRYLIVDDEHIAHEIIKGYCDVLPNMRLMKHCYDAFEAIEYLREHTVDLIFLDLNMPKLKGFQFLKTLSSYPNIIVTTAYKEYALEGYELEITDYLLKPFSFERFLKAVNKALHSKNSNITIKGENRENEEQIFLYSNKKHIQVKLNDILYIEASGNYSKVVLSDNQNIMIREKISDMLSMLSHELFLHVHKSFIVAKKHIKSIEGNQIKIADYTVPVGKSYKSNINNLLNKTS